MVIEPIEMTILSWREESQENNMAAFGQFTYLCAADVRFSALCRNIAPSADMQGGGIAA